MTRCRFCFTILFLPLVCFSARPRQRTFNAFADFSRARLQGITVWLEGSFTLGSRRDGCSIPAILTSGPWSPDGKGNLYLGSATTDASTGSPRPATAHWFFDAPEWKSMP
jgi:hypothetical protein